MAIKDDEGLKNFNETKRQLDTFVDGLISTLNTEFQETSVTPNSSKHQKLELLGKLAKELEGEYGDTEKLY